MPRQVIVDKRFKQFDRELQRAVARGLEETGRAVAASAKGTQTDYKIASVLASIDTSSAMPDRRGLAVYVFARDWRSMFFEKGTYHRRGRARTRAAKAVEGSRGVKPVRFLRKGLKAEFPSVTARIRRQMRG